jgi:CubicO group peptidase (beta-lactamase class C family)
MVGSGPDFVRFLEAVRTGGTPILTPRSTELLMSNQLGTIAIADGPGEGHGYGGGVIVDPVAAGVPHSPGTWWWGGAYGHRWFVDPLAGLTAALLTNTASEGSGGQLVDDALVAIYL